MPRAMEPRASSKVLPCSWVTKFANFGVFSTRRARNCNRIWMRFVGVVWYHSSHACWAAATAWLQTTRSAMGARPMHSPVAGL